MSQAIGRTADDVGRTHGEGSCEMDRVQGMDAQAETTTGPQHTPLARIGVFAAPCHTEGPTAPFWGAGSHVACQRLVEALATRSTAQRLDVFLPPAGAAGPGGRGWAGTPIGPPAARPTTQFLAEAEIGPQLRSGHYDALHEVSTPLSRLSYLRSRFSASVFPITSSQHGVSYSFDLFRLFISMLTVQIYPCDAVVCLSRDSRHAYEQRLREVAGNYSRVWGKPPPSLPRCELIPWGIDTGRFCPRDRELARMDLALPQGEVLVLCVGRARIEDKMDWTPLLLAFRRATASAGVPAVLVLAGATSSNYGDAILLQAQRLGLAHAVRSFWNLPDACLPGLYAACDVFVSPTDTLAESFGLTVVEAMACGRPVVASDWDGYKDLIEHGGSGFLVRTDWADCLGDLNDAGPGLSWQQEHLHAGQSVSVDVGEMSTYLADLLRNPDLRERMGRRARHLARSLYDWSIIVPRWEALWSELAAVAQTLSPSGPEQMQYMQSNYFQNFGHYSSFR